MPKTDIPCIWRIACVQPVLPDAHNDNDFDSVKIQPSEVRPQLWLGYLADESVTTWVEQSEIL